LSTKLPTASNSRFGSPPITNKLRPSRAGARRRGRGSLSVMGRQSPQSLAASPPPPTDVAHRLRR
jgi:hypothetical protein